MIDTKYGYAFDSEKNIIHIEDVSEESRRNTKYYCIVCGDEMTARLGKIRKHHFAHKNNNDCNGETYLHKIAKYLFKRKWDNSKEFKIELDKHIVCNKFNECKLYSKKLCYKEEKKNI